MVRRLAGSLVLTGLFLAAAGCGGSTRGAVQGRVTVNGAPLEEGEISFVPLDPRLGPTAGAPVRDGAYRIDAARGPVAGDYRVRVHAFRKTGRKVWDGMGDDKAPAARKTFVEEVEAFIPPRYNEQSELQVRIEGGKVNEYNCDLQIGRKP